jgi:hypothetical protein
MTCTDPERTTPRIKVAMSRFVLLDSLSTNPLKAEINWDDVAEPLLSDCCCVIVALSKSYVAHFYDVIYFCHHTVLEICFLTVIVCSGAHCTTAMYPASKAHRQ